MKMNAVRPAQAAAARNSARYAAGRDQGRRGVRTGPPY
jgi:hypothetical protein